MRDSELLFELLEAETEEEVLGILKKRDLLSRRLRWRYLGDMPNNQSIVQNQQSSPAAALIEKFTNGLDAILLRQCKKSKIDPRAPTTPSNMSEAIQTWFGDLNAKTTAEIRSLGEENLIQFVFKYGLALIAMGLLDTATRTDDWKSDPDKIRDGISKSSEGIARVIVPLCLSLPSKLPKAA